ncbi:PTS mannose/fructose/sorbose/N-acetylgalactosamine transporter subunit IIC [Lederbergia citri]|uniref:PTS sugar transporter subunit IIC n=1 Tax=Lederbergia citri TaxID=2833580 RepID=A0A942TDD7_9BACI|nr:PTS sugar transporter subunit IIC [Lederbergia citri]MBS4195780.1 PTS sugar transporter subunit IIC [Lederbergia citri]
MTLIQAILIASWAGISGNYFMDYLGFARPIVSGLVVGIILGDITTGVILGATIEVIFLGIFTVGAALAPDHNLAGIIGVALGIASGYGVETAVTIALPAALLGQFLMMAIVYPGNLFPLHLADKYAAQGRTRPIELAFYSGGILWFLKGFIPTLLATYYGVKLVEKVFDSLPTWLVDGFNIIGGILPAVGFAMLLNVIGVSGRVWAFFTIGFVFVSYLHLDIIAIAIIGVVFAYLLVTRNTKAEGV